VFRRGVSHRIISKWVFKRGVSRPDNLEGFTGKAYSSLPNSSTSPIKERGENWEERLRLSKTHLFISFLSRRGGGIGKRGVSLSCKPF